MPTDPQLHAAEITAGMNAIRNAVAAHVPAWERNLIPDAALQAAVEAVVTAVDTVRANWRPPVPPNPTPAGDANP